jgi:hypothetical protein
MKEIKYRKLSKKALSGANMMANIGSNEGSAKFAGLYKLKRKEF